MGGFHSVHGLAVARLRADGSLDRAFLDRIAKAAVTGGVTHIRLEPDGSLLLGGTFAASRRPEVDLRVLKVWPAGTVDQTFLQRALRGEVQPGREEIIYPPGGQLAARVGFLGYDGRRVEFASAGPTGTTVVFYSEPIPKPPPPPDPGYPCADGETLPFEGALLPPCVPVGFECGAGDEYAPRRHQVAFVDADGRLLWGVEVSQAEVRGVFVQAQGLLVWGRMRGPAGNRNVEDDMLLWRLGPGGLDPSFHAIHRSELGGKREMWPGYIAPDIQTMAVLRDGRIVIAGDFDSVRGRRRVHIGRLRPDGSLEE